MFLPNRRRLGVRLVFALGAMALFVVGYQWGNQYKFGSTERAGIRGVLIQPPGEIPEFGLRDPFGRPFGRMDLTAGWTLLAFGDLAEATGQRAAQRLIETRNRLADRLDRKAVNQPSRPGRSLGGTRRRQRLRRSIHRIRIRRTSPGYGQRALRNWRAVIVGRIDIQSGHQ